MKIVRNYKRLKKWAKTLFVTLLTICIVFTSTGVATLFAYADPTDEGSELHEHIFNTTEYESNNDGTHTVKNICECGFEEETTQECVYEDGVCSNCGYEKPEESHIHSYTTTYISNNDGTHKKVELCDCNDVIENDEAEECVFVDGVCSLCGYENIMLKNDSDSESSQSSDNSTIDDLLVSKISNGYKKAAPLLKGVGTNGLPNETNDTSIFYEIVNGVLPSGRNETYDGNQKEIFTLGSFNNEAHHGAVKKPVYTFYKKNGSSYELIGNDENYRYQINSGDYAMSVSAVYYDGTEKNTSIQNYFATISPLDISSYTINPVSYLDYVKNGGFKIDGIDTSNYTYSVVQSFPPEAGSSFEVTLTGINNCKGSLKGTVNVEDVNVLFNGVEQVEKYYDNVVLSATGYTISLSEDGEYAQTAVISNTGDYTLYCKNKSVPDAVIKKSVTINIINIPIKYDNDINKAESYYGSVQISADGYTISKSNNGTFFSKYTHDTLGEGQVFTLYFRSSQGDVIPITISGITILPKPEPEITINYQGEKVNNIDKCFYDKVEISATGYKISRTESGTFTDKYIHKELGEDQLFVLYFRDNTTGTITPKTIENLTIVSRTVTPDIIPIKYNNENSINNPYYDKVDITAQGYKIGISETGPFMDKYSHTTIGDNQVFILYFWNNEKQEVTAQSIQGITIKKAEVEPTVIQIKYDGGEKKTEPYKEKVSISAIGYTVSATADGTFNKTYVYKTLGENQSFNLYFMDDNTGDVIRQTITGITIIKDESYGENTSKGKITIGNYSSEEIAASENIGYSTRDIEKITIDASNDDVGIMSIDYATSEEIYYTISDISGAVTDGKIKWKEYMDSSKPSIPSNKEFYVYARITDTKGNYLYISSSKIIHDSTSPEITNAVLAAKDESDDNILAVIGKDNLIGIDRFYMIYEEKKSDSKTPKPEDVVKDGNDSGVDTRNKDEAGAFFTLSDLETDKIYIFHIVAKDKLGNLSEIKTIESKGKGSSKSYGADSSSSATASSGLTPAPNGIAGPGNKKTPKTGTTGIPQKTSQEVNVSSLDREINRIPYISDATGDTKIGIDATGGWDKITNEVKNASPGISMDVEMSGFSVVPDKVFSTMMGKNLNVRFLMPEDVEWIINGQNIKSTSGTDLDLGVRIGAKNIPSDMLNPVVEAYPHTEIELKHNGTFGFSGILRIPLGKSNAGLYAYLYYYDTKEKEMKLMQSTQISSTGYAEFEFNHASDYSIVIRGEEMTTVGTAKSNNAFEGEDTSVDNTSAYKTFRLTDFAGSRASVRMWLFMIAIISAVMCGLILYMPGLKDEETLEKV